MSLFYIFKLAAKLYQNCSKYHKGYSKILNHVNNIRTFATFSVKYELKKYRPVCLCVPNAYCFIVRSIPSNALLHTLSPPHKRNLVTTYEDSSRYLGRILVCMNNTSTVKYKCACAAPQAKTFHIVGYTETVVELQPSNNSLLRILLTLTLEPQLCWCY